jgi:hypothetical protein
MQRSALLLAAVFMPAFAHAQSQSQDVVSVSSARSFVAQERLVSEADGQAFARELYFNTLFEQDR